MSKKNGTVVVKLSDDERERLRSLAEARGVTMSQLVRQLVRQLDGQPTMVTALDPSPPRRS